MDIRDVDQPFAAYGDRRGAIQYLQAFRRQWPLIAVLVVVAVGVTAALTLSAPKKYQATADVQVRPVSANNATFQSFSSVFQQSLDGSSVVVAAARLMNTPSV